jgi:lambda repressor-like predicted transcriptional regulator
VLDKFANGHHLSEMNVHRGKILEKAIREKGYTFAAAAKRMNLSRRTLYNYFEEPDLSWQKLIDFDQQLHLNLAEHFTQMSKFSSPSNTNNQVEEGLAPDFWRNKYIELLEKYTSLLERKKFK